MEFNSRRSCVVTLGGSVAASQPLAAEIGARIMRQGGNAADAAVAVAAALNCTEPCSTGIGGDCFCLYYDAVTKQVTGINGSGCSPAGLTLERVRADGVTGEKLPQLHAHTVTVPGAAAGWVDTVERHGTLSLSEVLQPAIDLAEQGFPVHSTAAHFWEAGSDKLRASENPHGADMLMADGSAPREGDVMEMPMLAQTFRRLAAKGRDGFYRGEVAEAIVAAVRQRGGVLTMEDLAEHCSRFDDPIHVSYRGTDIWEIPPNGQGLTALMALNILEEFDVAALGHNSAAYLHTLIEALRLSFADTLWHVADPEQNPAPLDALLSKEYARSRAALIQPDRAAADVVRGSPLHSSDTVYFCVVDGKGNACSFINSNYMGFGTGIVPKGCGFTLQNRGANFDLTPGHPNVLAPRKRPYHTIIPGMATRDGELYAAFGVMGGFMQPQGHVQVLLNMLDFGMNPQEALDSLRFCIGSGHTGAVGGVSLEHGLPQAVVQKLKDMGHDVDVLSGHSRAKFGRGQIIARQGRRRRDGSVQYVHMAGSDPRADGMAIGLS